MVAGVIALTALPFVVIFQPDVTIELPAILFFAVYLTLAFLRLRRLTPTYLKQRADVADAPAFVILGVTVLAIVAAIGSLFLALNREQQAGLGELALAVAAVVLGWLTIHTMAAMHYAHVYWRPSRSSENGRRGGLDFPGTPDPCGHDFLYFSLVIGMTAQNLGCGDHLNRHAQAEPPACHDLLFLQHRADRGRRQRCRLARRLTVPRQGPCP